PVDAPRTARLVGAHAATRAGTVRPLHHGAQLGAGGSRRVLPRHGADRRAVHHGGALPEPRLLPRLPRARTPPQLGPAPPPHLPDRAGASGDLPRRGTALGRTRHGVDGGPGGGMGRIALVPEDAPGLRRCSLTSPSASRSSARATSSTRGPRTA